MLACTNWLGADFFLRHGFTIHDHGHTRVAVRGHLTLDLGPACGHADCPPHDHPNYHQTEKAA
jgi:hypothetical protein